jgi:outer membrane protein OmpA-like peptidoglycan-associated protein
MHARLLSGVLLAFGCADLAVLDLLLAPRLAALGARAAEPAAIAAEPAPTAAPRAAAPPAPPAPIAAAPPAHPPAVGPERAAADITFELGEARLRYAARVELVRVARELRGDPDRGLRVRGHADRLGAPALNLSLSRWRAEEVTRFLVSHGAPRARLTLEARGDLEPSDPSDTPTAWAKNRRVELFWR